jgi:hypothetical protein
MAKRKARLKIGTRDYAKGKAAVTLAQPSWDMGATGQANRIGLVTEDAGEVDRDTGKWVNPNGVKRARRVDMLEVYHERGWISDRGYTAGEALRDAWTGTQRGKGTDWSMERVDSSSKPDAHIDIQIDRVSRYLAVSSLIPTDDMDIVFAVACDAHAISRLKRYRGISHERGKVHLRAALDRLADVLKG